MNTSTNNQPSSSANPVFMSNNTSNSSEHETSWRSKFPKTIVFILAIIELIFIILIFILEIASLATVTYRPTGVGIWCAIPFLIACILTFILGKIFLFHHRKQEVIICMFIFVLVRKQNASRIWATRVFIAQIVLLIFTFILIGITGNYVQTYAYFGSGIYTSYSSIYWNWDKYTTKYRIIQAQLAFGILLMFSGFTYVGIYIYVTIVALWQPYHTLDTDHLFRE
jgi:hypothetical protein